MRNLLIITCLFIYSGKASGQFIETLWYNNTSEIEAFNFMNLDSSCNKTFKYCPNLTTQDQVIYDQLGNSYVLKVYRGTFSEYGILIFKFDGLTCNIENIDSIIWNDGYQPRDRFYIDYLGTLYFSSTKSGNPDVFFRLNKIENFLNKSTRKLSYKPINKTFSLQDYDRIGQKNIAIGFVFDSIQKSDDFKFFEVDEGLNLIREINFPYGIISFINLSENCTESKVYAVGYVDHFYKVLNDPSANDTLYLFEYNIQKNEFTKICSLGPNYSGLINLRSKSEFLSTDPECDLLLDLDRDNSSGVFPYDFLAGNFSCSDTAMSLVDKDVYLYTSTPLDSIVITMEGVIDFTNEVLIYKGNSQIDFIKVDAVRYVLKPTGTNNSDTIFNQALQSLFYQYQATNKLAGRRIISFQGFSPVKNGTVAKTFIDVISENKTPLADTILNFCSDLLLPDMRSVLNATVSGFWEPSLASGTNTFDSKLDTSRWYQFISLPSLCGNDTAEVKINREESRSILAPSGLSLCSVDNLVLTIKNALNNDAISWNDGDSKVTKSISSPGKYTVTVITGAGCQFMDSVVVSGEILNESHMAYICKGDSYNHNDGKTYFDGDTFSERRPGLSGACDTFYNYTVIARDNPQPEITGKEYLCKEEKTKLSTAVYQKYEWSTGAQTRDITVGPGSYQIKVTDSLNCTGRDTFTVDQLEDVNVDVPEKDFILSPGENAITLIGDFNKITTVVFEPNIQIVNVLGNKVTIVVEKSGEYALIFTDSNGCLSSTSINIKIDRKEDVFYSNIIRIGGQNNENASWILSHEDGLQFTDVVFYDRWGNRVAKSSLPEWDGKSGGVYVTPGVYVFQASFIQKENNQILQTIGTITVAF